jgi:hypothetical protein
MSQPLPTRRQRIFLDLVNLQDQGISTSRSRRMIQEKYDLSDADLLAIELEGIDKEWPPLNPADAKGV